MSSNPLKSNKIFEYSIIKNLLEDEYYFDKVVSEIKPIYFRDKKSRTYIKHIKKYFDQYRKMPDYSDITVDLVDQADVTVLSKIKKMSTVNSYDKLLEDTEKFVRTNMAYNFVLDNVDELDEYDDFTKVAEFLDGFKETSDEIINFNLNEQSDTLSIADFGRYEEEYQDTLKDEYRITTGFNSFDSWLQGGYQKKKLSLYFAPSHVGKTMIMFNNAVAAYRDGKVVLYITLEIDKYEAYTRIAARLVEKPTIYVEDKVNSNEVHKKLKQVDSKCHGQLLIEEYPTRTLTVNKLESFLEDFKDEHKQYPDIMFIDYIQIMAPPDNVSLYEKGAYLTDGVRRIASEKEIAIVSAVQLGREAQKKSNPDESSVSESKYYFDGADNVIIMSRDKDMEGIDSEFVKFTIRKNRQAGIINKQVPFKSIPSIQMFEEKGSNKLDSGVNIG